MSMFKSLQCYKKNNKYTNITKVYHFVSFIRKLSIRLIIDFLVHAVRYPDKKDNVGFKTVVSL